MAILAMSVQGQDARATVHGRDAPATAGRMPRYDGGISALKFMSRTQERPMDMRTILPQVAGMV